MLRPANTLVTSYTFVSPLDPALDTEAEEELPDGTKKRTFPDRWQRYLDGTGECPVRAGEKPTVFTLRHLRTAERALLDRYVARAVSDSSESLAACIAAFAVALESVENLSDAEGKAVKAEFDVDTNGIYPVRIASQKTLDAVGHDVAVSVGRRVIERLSLGPS